MILSDNRREQAGNGTEEGRLLPMLEERVRLRRMLEQLGGVCQGCSPEVLERVGADYRARLESLGREIRRQARNFELSLSDYRELLERLERAVEMGERSLEELRVRHALGEYRDDEYIRVLETKQEKLDLYRGKIRSFRSNVGRLEEVLSRLDQDSTI